METQVKSRLTTNAILGAVATYYNIPISTILSKTRKDRVVQPRQMVHYLSKKFKTDCLQDIAEATGLTNHATICHSFKTVNQQRGLYAAKQTDITQVILILRKQGYNVPVVRARESERVDKRSRI